MLRKVVAARELLAALMTLERLVVSVKGSDVSLQVFLASESTVADVADEGLRGVFGERLLAATAIDGSCLCVSTSLRGGTHGVVRSVGFG
jgi:hypothetical protein